MSDVPTLRENARLSATVVDGVLTVTIGVNTLAHCATYSDWANPWNDERDDYFRTFAITDAAAFGKDVALAMLSEAEDGSSPLTRFIDKAMSDAVDEGSMACCEDEHLIRFGQTAPCEKWSSQETERTTDGKYAVDRVVGAPHDGLRATSPDLSTTSPTHGGTDQYVLPPGVLDNPNVRYAVVGLEADYRTVSLICLSCRGMYPHHLSTCAHGGTAPHPEIDKGEQ